MFKTFIVECVQEIVKDKISAVVKNPKLSISNSKISPNAIKRFFIMTINNKHAKNTLILTSQLTKKS